MVLTRDVTDEIKSAVNTAMSKFLRDPTFIKTITESVAEAVTLSINKKLSWLEEKVTELKTEIKDVKQYYEKQINYLEGITKTIMNENSVMHKKCDNMEQGMKKNNLRIFNYKETERENLKQDIIKFLKEKMAININNADIELCYRVGKKTEARGKARGVFMKLRTYEMKQIIYGKKKLLKGTGVVVREDLTSVRLKMLNKAIEKTSLQNVWTNEGNIFVNFKNKICTLRSSEDYDKLFGIGDEVMS